MDAEVHVEDRDRIGFEKRFTYAAMKETTYQKIVRVLKISTLVFLEAILFAGVIYLILHAGY